MQKLTMVCVAALAVFSQAALAAEAILAPTDIKGLTLWLDASDASTMQRAAYQSESTAKHLGFHSFTTWKDKSGQRHDTEVVTVRPGGATARLNTFPKPRLHSVKDGRDKPFVAARNFGRIGRDNFSITVLDTQVSPGKEFTILMVGSSNMCIHTKDFASYRKDNPQWRAQDGEWNLSFRRDGSRATWEFADAWSYLGGETQPVRPDDACLVILRRGEEQDRELNVVGVDQEGARKSAQVGEHPEFVKVMAKEDLFGHSTLKLATLHGKPYYSEVLVFDRPLTDDELDQARTYLESKWLRGGCLARSLAKANPVDPVDAKIQDPAQWTYPDWSDGLPDAPRESTSTLAGRERAAEYLAMFEEAWEHTRVEQSALEEHAATGSLLPRDRNGHASFACFASINIAVEIYERTGNQFYLDYAKETFAKYLEGAAKHDDYGELQHGRGTGTYKYGNTLYRVGRYMDFTKEQAQVAKELGIGLAKYSGPDRLYACGNHSTRQFVGTAFVAKTFERDPDIQWLVDACRYGWELYQWKQSVQENDNSYGFYCLNSMIQMARAYGNGIDSFKGPAYQKLFERYTYLTTPSGHYPGFGYAGGSRADMKMVTVAEVAARATNDPACLYFAQKLYGRVLHQMRRDPPHRHGSDGNWLGAYDSAYCTYLLNLPKTDLRPALPTTLSKVYRTNEWKLDEESVGETNEAKHANRLPDDSVLRLGYDKLVLKTSNAPGGSMIMMDLASRRGGGDKSHPEKRPAIQYYEAQHVPLWVGIKYARASYTHNLVWLTPPDLEFPLMGNCEDKGRLEALAGSLNNATNPNNLVYGNAAAENKGDDAYGFVEFTSYYRPDTSLTRRMILTREGILVIRDDLMPGESVDGYKAGPLWNPMQSRSAENLEPEKVRNWWNFKARDCVTSADPGDDNAYSADLFLYYGKAQGRKCGAKRVDEKEENSFASLAKGWLVTYSCETLKAGKPVTFITLLVPHPNDVSGETLAEAVQSTVNEGEATISLTHKGDTVSMTFGREDNQWTVARTGK